MGIFLVFFHQAEDFISNHGISIAGVALVSSFHARTDFGKRRANGFRRYRTPVVLTAKKAYG